MHLDNSLPLLLPHHHVSGVLPEKSHVLYCIMCTTCLACCIWIFTLFGLGLLLQMTNSIEVHEACPGLWDFVLLSVLFPFISPCLYLMTQSWSSLPLALLLFLAILGTTISVQSSVIPVCVETLRASTPPFPWLLFVAWIKTILYMSGSLSTLLRWLHHKHYNINISDNNDNIKVALI